MHRQRFSTDCMPLHIFRVKFKEWLQDIELSRQFIVDEGADEYFVVGQNAYSYILSLEGWESPPIIAGSAGNCGTIGGIRIVSCAYQQHQHKDAHDILPNDIEYRVVNP